MAEDEFSIFARPKPVGPHYEIKPGEGNLQMQAYFAAIVGPHRIAMGAKRTFNLEQNETQRIANVNPASRHCAFIAVYLPVSSAGPATVSIGSEDMLGDSAGIPVQLFPRIGPAAAISFAQVLLPGETLFALNTNLLTLNIIVSQVDF